MRCYSTHRPVSVYCLWYRNAKNKKARVTVKGGRYVRCIQVLVRNLDPVKKQLHSCIGERKTKPLDYNAMMFCLGDTHGVRDEDEVPLNRQRPLFCVTRKNKIYYKNLRQAHYSIGGATSTRKKFAPPDELVCSQ